MPAVLSQGERPCQKSEAIAAIDMVLTYFHLVGSCAHFERGCYYVCQHTHYDGQFPAVAQMSGEEKMRGRKICCVHVNAISGENPEVTLLAITNYAICCSVSVTMMFSFVQKFFQCYDLIYFL